jgi:hypothetical protein
VGRKLVGSVAVSFRLIISAFFLLFFRSFVEPALVGDVPPFDVPVSM